MENILELLLQFGQLAGIAALLAALVNVGKWFGLVADGDAGKVFAMLNLIALSVLVALRIFAPAVLIADIDAQAAVLAQIVAVVLGYVVQLRVGMATHESLSRLRVPVIGMSYTELEFEGEQG
jgi:hypothetical protein